MAKHSASNARRMPLSWVKSIGGSLLALAVILPLAIVFNVAIGRIIHWDIVAALSGLAFVGLTLVLRYGR